MTEQPAATPASDTVAALRVELMALEAELPALEARLGRRYRIVRECSAELAIKAHEILENAYQDLRRKNQSIDALYVRIDAAKSEASQ